MFTNEDLTNLPPTDFKPHITMPNISFTIDGILNLLQDLDVNKSSGPDEIPAIVLKKCALEIAPILQVIYMNFLVLHIMSNCHSEDFLLVSKDYRRKFSLD